MPMGRNLGRRQVPQLQKPDVRTRHTKHQCVPRRSKAVPHTALLNTFYLYINFPLSEKLIWHVSASSGQKDAARENYQRAYGFDKTLKEAKDSADKLI